MNIHAAATPPDALTGLRIGGFQPFTTLDFPGRMAAVVFLQGCPLRCVYCHNPELIPPGRSTAISWAAVRQKLERRRGLLQAIVFSGGEPLVQSRLPEALRQAREMGFATGLHTTGVLPGRLARLEGLLDWVGFDIKAPFGRYCSVTGVDGSGLRARESLDHLTAWGIPFEIRVTVWPDLIGSAEIIEIADQAQSRSCRDFVLQECRDPSSGLALGGPVFSDAALLDELEARFPGFKVRRA
ncbi:anaerobic ribonucleoside-triphosphate reductase activating protein [Hyphobacterium sp. HN65]|uniref:Anaerobic ribonucleoside-triphosphate reductase activating protein n=1 Tax=Hyphobacterium lacteum TaxID=3116575 RepID=A0ABU7LP54_9PROT|nr:anaerobic ribonucleoside-triphosphate reductase activating protein [Hyphobacterium sp. HN65]MEE2525693.1 anaerobic ribonucleoside-triphosphate reductase activating protein [Hyphobacterium sp. HN65]